MAKKPLQDKKKLSNKIPQPAAKTTSANESSSSGKISRGRGRPRKYPIPEPTKNVSNSTSSKSSQDKKLVTTRGSTRVSRILAASHRTTTATDSDSDTGMYRMANKYFKV